MKRTGRREGRTPRGAVAVLGAFVLALSAASAASADTSQSSNWAGYAAHGSGISFRRVFGAWRQPAATCTAGAPSYSSVWVGLGGYSQRSRALEQIGSETDCSRSGAVVSSAWYELVPAPSRTIHMTVNPGDLLSASVGVTGHRVLLELSDLTRHTRSVRPVSVRPLDVTSAEWIVEAPSACSSNSSCQELALADFGSAGFTRARAVTSTGHQAGIVDRRWRTTAITLASGARHFASAPATGSGATASPSPLTAGGTAFTVTYAGSGTGTSAGSIGTTPSQGVRGATLVRPGRRS